MHLRSVAVLERGGKKRLVAGSLEPGTGVSAMAREAGFHPSQLYGWRRLRARREAVPEFAAVRIAAEPAPSEMPATGTIEVEFAKGSRVRITGPADVSLVRAMIAVIAKAGRELPVIGERIFTTHDALPPAGASRKPRRVAPSTRRDAYDARFVDSGSRRFKP